MEYNVGDKVRIRKDLNFKGYEVTPTMQLDMGKIAEIIKNRLHIIALFVSWCNITKKCLSLQRKRQKKHNHENKNISNHIFPHSHSRLRHSTEDIPNEPLPRQTSC